MKLIIAERLRRVCSGSGEDRSLAQNVFTRAAIANLRLFQDNQQYINKQRKLYLTHGKEISYSEVAGRIVPGSKDHYMTHKHTRARHTGNASSTSER